MILAAIVLLAEAATLAIFGLYAVTMMSMYADPEGRDAGPTRDPVGRSLVWAARTGFLAGVSAIIVFSLAGVL